MRCNDGAAVTVGLSGLFGVVTLALARALHVTEVDLHEHVASWLLAIGTNPVASHAAAIHRPNAWEKAPGASLAKTRSKVSGLGMPLSSGRDRRKKSALVRPSSAIASQDSAPAMMAQVAYSNALPVLRNA